MARPGPLTGSADGLRRRPRHSTRRGAIPRQLLRLPLVRRSRIVNTAQDTAIHQVPRRLVNFTITFLTTRHSVVSLPGLRPQLLIVSRVFFGLGPHADRVLV